MKKWFVICLIILSVKSFSHGIHPEEIFNSIEDGSFNTSELKELSFDILTLKVKNLRPSDITRKGNTYYYSRYDEDEFNGIYSIFEYGETEDYILIVRLKEGVMKSFYRINDQTGKMVELGTTDWKIKL